MTTTAPVQTATKRPIYYGWWVLWVTMAIAFFGAICSQIFTGTMLPSIEESTGWSRSAITLAVTLGGLLGGFLSPMFGRLADRHGPRLLSSLGIIVTIAALVGIGFSGTIGLALFYVSYVLGRSTSQNTMTGVIARTTAVNWFRRKRGRAIGITSMAVPLGGAAMIPVAQLLMDTGLTWSQVYYVFAAFMLVFLLPVAALVLRRRPEDLGLRPDGDDEATAAAETAAIAREPAEYSWTLQQAVRTRALWLLIGAQTIGVCANGAIGFHQFAYFKDEGVAAAAAATAISVYSLSGAVSNGLWGFIVERFSERIVGTISVLGAAGTCLFLMTVNTTVEALTFAVLFGLLARGESSIIVMMEAQYFGRNSFGTISGFSAPFQQVALGFGPALAAVLYEASGQSYTIAFALFAVMFVASALMIWLARKPPPPDAITAAA